MAAVPTASHNIADFIPLFGIGYGYNLGDEFMTRYTWQRDGEWLELRNGIPASY